MFFLSLLLIATIGFIATDVYLPSLPFITEDFNTTQSLVQLTLAAYLLPFGLSQIYYGPLSERVGRKKTVMHGLYSMVLGSVVCLFSPNIYILILGRFIEGMGVGAGSAVFRAILRDVYHGDDLSQKGSYLAVGNSFCMAAAPAIGGYIQYFLSWRYNFVFIVLYSLLVLLIVYLFLPETHKNINPKKLGLNKHLKHYKMLIKSPIFMGYCGCTTLAFGGLTAYLTLSPFLFQDVLHFTAIEYGWLAVFIAFGLGLGGLTNSLFVRPLGRHRLLRIGTYLQIFAGLFMLIFALFSVMNTSVIMIPMLIYMFGASWIFSNAFAGAFHFYSSIAGFAGALYGTFQIGGSAFFAILISLLKTSSQIPLAITILIIGILNYFLQKLGHKFTLLTE